MNLSADSVDSLQNIINNTQNDSIKSDSYLKLASYYYPGDKESTEYIDLAVEYAYKSNNEELIAMALFYKAADLNFYSEYDSAIVLLDIAIDYFERNQDTLNAARSWGEKGNSYCYQAIYYKCLDCFLKTYEYTIVLDNVHFMALVMNNIGNVYYFMEQPDKALEFFKKAFDAYTSEESIYGMALSANNIGSVFLDFDTNLDSAKYYFLISEKSAIFIDYKEQLAETSANLARVYSLENNFKKSELYSLKAINLNKEIGSLHGLAKTYWAYGVLLYDNKFYNKSKEYLDSALSVSLNAGVFEHAKNSYRWLSKVDSAQGNYHSALVNFMKYSDLDDSLASADVEKQIAGMQSNFDLKLKETENELLQLKNAKQQNIIDRQRIITGFISVALILFFVLIVLLLNISKQRKRYNQKLEEKNQEILQQKEEISSQNDVLLSKNHEIDSQREILLKYQHETSASITYAYRIQKASLPDIELFKTVFSDVSLLYMPRDIVSGDFYFFKKLTDRKAVVCVADCTGHGVPGALMSVLNIAFLNEVLKDNNSFTAAQILSNIREMIKIALKQNIENDSLHDGMDAALFVIDTVDNELNFAGANRHLHIFSNDKLHVLKGDKQPVAAFIREKEFNNQQIILNKGDVIYLFTDGYADQISANGAKKFLISNFKTLLADIHKLPFEEQNNILIKKFEEHKQQRRQTDDIAVLALKY